MSSNCSLHKKSGEKHIDVATTDITTHIEGLEESLKNCKDILLENQLLKDMVDSHRILLGATALLPLLQQAESVPSSQT